MQRTNYSSGTSWEEKVCYSRAVRIGNMIEVAGTVASDENGNIIGIGDVGKQAHFIFEKIRKVLQQAGAEMKDVVRTRMYVTNIDDFEKVGEAHAHFFKGINPVSTLIEISRLVNDDLLLEIEVSAWIENT